MTEQHDNQQRSLAGYKSQVHEQGEYDNPNEGKPVLDDSEEYVLKLIAFPNVRTFDQIKENKDGSRKTIKVDKAICEFEETKTKNIVTAFFRVDSLNFSDEESFESGVVRFFKKIKNPLPENVSPDWTKYFLVGMRFRGRVAIGKGQDKKPNARYYLDVPTCRPLLQSDTAGEDFEHAGKDAATQTAKEALAPAATLTNALLLAKGAKTYQEAMDKLQSASAPKDLVMALFQAHLDGKLTFPI